MLILVCFRFILRICRTVKLGWVIIRVPFYSLPIGSDKTSGLLKVGCIVQVLFTPLNLSFHAPACLAPFSKISSRFFIASLVSQLLIFMFPPNLLELLLFQIVRRVIHEVIRAPFKLVDCSVSHFLLAIRVELFEGRLEGGSFSLGKLISHLWKHFCWTSSFSWTAHIVCLAVCHADRHVIDRA